MFGFLGAVTALVLGLGALIVRVLRAPIGRVLISGTILARVQEARQNHDDESVKKAVNEYDEALESTWYVEDMKAEELMRKIEKEEEQVAYDDPEKKIYHLCIVNLVIGTLYCAKGNYEFGISRIMKSLEPYNKKALMDVDEVYTLEEITAEPLPEAEAKEVKQKKKKKKKNKKGPESLNECRKEESELLKAVAPPEKNVASTDVSKVQEEESEMESTVKDSHLYQRTSIDELFMEYRDPRLLRRTDKACEIGTAMSSIRVQSERKPVVELPTDPRIQKGIPSNVKPLVGDNKQASDCHLKDKINLIGKQIPADPRIRPRPDSQGKVDSVKPFVEETVHAGITQLQEDRRQMQKQPLAVDPRTRPSLESQEQEDSNVEPVSEKVQVDIRRQMQKQPLAVDPRLQPRPQSQEQ
ncbi:predicted protein, partial [Nematostella vectensis]